MGELYALCPRRAPEMTAETARAWCMALRPYRAEDVEQAALTYARSKEWFPSVAELVRGLRADEWSPRDLERVKKAYEHILNTGKKEGTE